MTDGIPSLEDAWADILEQERANVLRFLGFEETSASEDADKSITSETPKRNASRLSPLEKVGA